MEEIEKIWKKHESQIDESITLNHALLTAFVKKNVREEVSRPEKAELISSVLTLAFAGYMMVLAVRLQEFQLYSITAVIAAVSALGLVCFSVIRQIRIAQLGHIEQEVSSLQERIASFNLLRSRLAFPELILSGVALVSMWPVVLYTGFGIDVSEQPGYLLLFVGIALMVAVPVAIWVEIRYRRHLMNALSHLKEIRNWKDPKTP